MFFFESIFGVVKPRRPILKRSERAAIAEVAIGSPEHPF